MTRECAERKVWTKPQIKHLGEIQDIQGPSGSGTQGGKS